jgi:glucose-6-phosphate 1-dehydrogenase
MNLALPNPSSNTPLLQYSIIPYSFPPMPQYSTTPFSANPLREGLATRAIPEPCSMVIFGATGDLTHRKLIPALYNLAADGDLPPGLTVLGFARRDKDDTLFRQELEEAAKKYSRQAINDDLWKSFGNAIFYHRSEFNDPDGYRRLKERLEQIDRERGTRGNRLFYLSAGPDQFEPILSHIREAGLNDTSNGGWARVIVEKPFGVDLTTAHHLNSVVSKAFSEDATFRIDHYLGKETAQNIMVLRFANAIFEHLWNQRYIDHIQITANEQLGVENRAGYYGRIRRTARHGPEPSAPTTLPDRHGTAHGR